MQPVGRISGKENLSFRRIGIHHAEWLAPGGVSVVIGLFFDACDNDVTESVIIFILKHYLSPVTLVDGTVIVCVVAADVVHAVGCRNGDESVSFGGVCIGVGNVIIPNYQQTLKLSVDSLRVGCF